MVDSHHSSVMSSPFFYEIGSAAADVLNFHVPTNLEFSATTMRPCALRQTFLPGEPAFYLDALVRRKPKASTSSALRTRLSLPSGISWLKAQQQLGPRAEVLVATVFNPAIMDFSGAGAVRIFGPKFGVQLGIERALDEAAADHSIFGDEYATYASDATYDMEAYEAHANVAARITPKIDVGAEVAFGNLRNARPGLALAARFRGERGTWVCGASTERLVHATLVRGVSLPETVKDVNVEVACSLELDAAATPLRTTSTVGWRVRLPLLGVQIRTSFTGWGRCRMTLEESMGGNVACSISADLDHWANRHAFGLRVQYGEAKAREVFDAERKSTMSAVPLSAPLGVHLINADWPNLAPDQVQYE